MRVSLSSRSVLNDVAWRRVIWMQRFFCETETLGPIAQKWEISSFPNLHASTTHIAIASNKNDSRSTSPWRYEITSNPHAQHPVARAFHPQPPRDRQEHRRQDGVFQTRPFRPGMNIHPEPLHQPRLTSVWPGHRRPRPSPNPEPASATQRIWKHRPSTQRPLHLRRQCPP